MFKNTSKYRHLQGKEAQRADWYPDLQPSPSTEAHLISASESLLAVVWHAGNGGSVAVLPIAEQGKRKGALPLIHAHAAQIYDLAFSPFSGNLLATGSEDATAKLWKLPAEGLTSDLSAAELTLSGHSKRVDSLRFHPSAENVIATGSTDKSVKVWDLCKGTAVLELDHPDWVSDLTWNYDGSILATTCKDRKVRLWDPRANAIVQEALGHEGVKPARVAWLGKFNAFVTTGFSKFRDRQFRVYDQSKLSAPAISNTVDSSTGVLVPLYDTDSNLLFLAGKGDAGIKFYECTPQKVNFLNACMSTAPQRDVCCLPKLACDVASTEIVRIFRLIQDAVAPVTFTVPRKLKHEFASDLYPDTASREPALSAGEWFSGKTSSPKTTSISASQGSSQPIPQSFSAAATSRSAFASKDAQVQKPATIANPEIEATAYYDPNRKVEYAGDRIVEEVEEVEYIPKEVKIVRTSKFRHIHTKTWKSDLCFQNVKAYNQSIDSPSLKANPSYFAVPWFGPGGKLAVIPLDKPGKLPDTFGMVETGDVLYTYDLSPFHDSLLATGTENGQIKVWDVPAGLMDQEQNYTKFSLEFSGHSRRVSTLDFHTVANNILLSTGMDMTLRLWDIQTGKEAFCCEVLKDYCQHVVFNYDGSLTALSLKNKTISVLDPRTSSVAMEQPNAHDGAKGVRLAWLGNSDRVVSAGFSRGSTRQFSIWDVRKFGSPITTATIDTCSGVITPIFDEDTDVLFFTGRGDGEISFYELKDESPFYHFIGKHQTSVPQMDVVALPKTVCNFREAEIRRMLKLTTSGVDIISFKIPRTRKEYFQDDLFPPTRDGKPSIEASEWLSGKNKSPNLISLQPADMKPLSEAPKIVREKKYKFNPKAEPEKDFAEKQKDVLDKFSERMLGFDGEAVGINPNAGEGVNWDEWDMDDY